MERETAELIKDRRRPRELHQQRAGMAVFIDIVLGLWFACRARFFDELSVQGETYNDDRYRHPKNGHKSALGPRRSTGSVRSQTKPTIRGKGYGKANAA